MNIDNNGISKIEENNNDEKISESINNKFDEYFIFDDFYPKVTDDYKRNKKNKKRTYIEAFGADNELKKFWNMIVLSNDKGK